MPSQAQLDRLGFWSTAQKGKTKLARLAHSGSVLPERRVGVWSAPGTEEEAPRETCLLAEIVPKYLMLGTHPVGLLLCAAQVSVDAAEKTSLL